MDLNIWTSSFVSSASLDENTKKWHVNVTTEDGSKRVFCVDHVLVCTGWVGDPYIPQIPGKVRHDSRMCSTNTYA